MCGYNPTDFMKHTVSVFLLLCVCFGCVPPREVLVPITLYGTAGPYEGKVISATVHPAKSNLKRMKGATSAPTGSGWVEMTMPDGEYCKGEYSIVQGGSVQNFMASRGFLNPAIYGNAVSSERSAVGSGIAVGANGTVMEVNFVTDTFSGHGFGVAKDNKGNEYRVQF
jgi:hypothetical protein